MNMEKIIKIAFAFLALLLGVGVYLAITMDRSRHEVNSSVNNTIPTSNNMQTNSTSNTPKQVEENTTTKEQVAPTKQTPVTADSMVKTEEKPKEKKNNKKEGRSGIVEDAPAIAQGQKFKANTITPKGE
ncbi:MAG: hypothetical protein PHE67_06030 [Campylobacterales bacterium]|nr:hypothetical protein [Campylobacterales bacterium]